MRILFVTNLYPPNAIGGYERLCFEMACAFGGRGHAVSVLTSSYGGRSDDYAGQRIERSLKLFATEGNIYQPFNCSPEERERISAENVTVLVRKVQAEQPDLLFVWNLYFFDRPFLQAIEHTERRVVYLLTDNWLITFLNGAFIHHYFLERVFGDWSWQQRIHAALRKLVSGLRGPRFAMRGKAIFASQFIRTLYAEAGFSYDNDVVIHHGVNLPDEGMPVVRTQLLDASELKLLFAGRIVDVKGVHIAIEALPRVIEALPNLNVKLTVLGDAQDQAYVERLKGIIRTHGLERAVTFAAAVGEKDLFGLFQQHDIYLFPSLYEPFSLTLIHALAAGIPTVASDAGGNPEIVRQRDTGLLFAKGDSGGLAAAVVELARDGELRRIVADNARCIARGYTFERMVEQVETYLGEVLLESA
jgi:glycogen synthase